MKEALNEYPAYNIFYRQGGNWMLHDSPIIGKPYEEAYNIAMGILFSNKRTEAVSVYGVFNCQQTFIQEISKENLPKPESNEERMRNAINEAISLCNQKACGFEHYGLRCDTLCKIRDLLSEAIETTKDVSGREKKGI